MTKQENDLGPRREVGTHHDIATFYDAVSDEFDAEYYGPDGDLAIQLDVARFRSILTRMVKSDELILELGSGTGEWLRFISGIGARGVGVDMSEGMCQAATRRGCTEVAVGDLSLLPFRDNIFDTVIAPYCALDHVSEFGAAFSEISRVTKDESKIVLMLDNANRLIRMYWRVSHSRVKSLGGDPRSTGDWRHLVDGQEVTVYTRMFTMREIRAMLPDFDLTFVGLGYITPLLPQWCRRRNIASALTLPVIGVVEAVLGRLIPNRCALLVAYGTKAVRGALG